MEEMKSKIESKYEKIRVNAPDNAIKVLKRWGDFRMDHDAMEGYEDESDCMFIGEVSEVDMDGFINRMIEEKWNWTYAR